MLEQWLRLIYLRGISINQKRYLVSTLGSPEHVVSSSFKELQHLIAQSGIGYLPRKSDSPTKKALDLLVERDMQCIHQTGAGFIDFESPLYPTLLKQIYGAPLGLFYRGNLELLTQPQIAIVGSRHASRSGAINAQNFAQGLSRAGLVITSGLAAGIDSAAHHGALQSKPGSTIAVIATGIDQVYPHSNRVLFEEIIQRGLVVGEYPPGTRPKRQHFPQRNRIISGLSLGTLVVEAGLRSGSLITARLAAEQGREVLAVPGSINSATSKGCHYLLRQGALLADSVEEILEALGYCSVDHHLMPEVSPSLSGELAMDPTIERVFSQLDANPCSIDQIISLSGLTADQVSSILIRLELQGLVLDSVDGYCKKPS